MRTVKPMTIAKAKALIESRQFPGDYFEMDGIIKNHNADKVALMCMDAQLRLKNLVDGWEYDSDRRFTGDAVKELLSQFIVEGNDVTK